MTFDFVEFAARIKRQMMYGSEIVYPFITVFTAIGVAKVAFGIPPELAFVIILCGVFLVGSTAVKIGLFGKDMDFVWRNSPIAKKLCDRVEKIEKHLIPEQKDEQEK